MGEKQTRVKREEMKALPTWKKLAYGLGNAGNCFIWVAISSFILIYCTNIIGIGAGLVGTLLMVAKVFDGITDIFMGRIIDVTKSRLGKARFWYFVSCLPLGICMYLIFNVPGKFSGTAKYTYVFVLYLLISAVFYTMNTVAYNMLVARVTKKQNDQVTMSSSSMVFGMVGSVFVASATPGFVEKFGGGQTGWHYVALMYSIIGVCILLIPFFTLKELPEEEFMESNLESSEKISFIQTLLELLKNKYFILILLLYLAGYTNAGIVQTIGIYFTTYVLNNASLLGILGLCSTIPMILGMPFVPKFISKFGMRKGCMIGNVVTLAGCAVAILGNFAGFPVMLAGLLIKGVGSLPGSATYTPFIVKADEYHYLKTGHRVTGSMFSCSTVGTKVGMGIGTALCGWLLEWSKFDGAAKSQTTLAGNVIIILYLVAPFALTIITGLIYHSMKVEDEVQAMSNK